MRVIDGDTVEVDVSAELSPELAELMVRLRGADTPEKVRRAKCSAERIAARAATHFTNRAVGRARVVLVRDPEWRKLGGRVVADLILDGRSLSAALIAAGHGRPLRAVAAPAFVGGCAGAANSLGGNAMHRMGPTLAAAALLLSGLAAGAAAVALVGGAQAADCASLRKCAVLSDNETRLACYDGLVKAAAKSDKPAGNPFEPTPGGGKPGAKREGAGERAARQPGMTEKHRKGLHCVSAWDGSHIPLKRHVRRQLRKPDSFEHIKTTIWPVSKAGTHRLRMRFRARNKFNWVVIASVLAEIENDGCAFTILETRTE